MIIEARLAFAGLALFLLLFWVVLVETWQKLWRFCEQAFCRPWLKNERTGILGVKRMWRFEFYGKLN